MAFHRSAAVLRPIDVDATLDRIGFGRFHWFTIPAIGLFVVAQSLQTNLLAFLPPCAGHAFGISPEDATLLASASFAASCASTPFFGLLADTHGRRGATLLAIYIMCAAGIGSTAAPSFGALVLLQLLVGIGLGGSCSPFELLAELSPSGSRGRALNAVSWFWSVGSLLTVLLAWLVLSPDSTLATDRGSDWIGSGLFFWQLRLKPWRLLVLATNLPVLIAACVLPLVTESPSWLLASGRRGSAKRVLWHMATVNRGGDATVRFSLRTGLLFLSSAYVHRPASTPALSVAVPLRALPAPSARRAYPGRPDVPLLDPRHLRQPLLPSEAHGSPDGPPPCSTREGAFVQPAVGSGSGSYDLGLSPRRGAFWLGLSPMTTPVGAGRGRSVAPLALGTSAFSQEASQEASREPSQGSSSEASLPLSAEASQTASSAVDFAGARERGVAEAGLQAGTPPRPPHPCNFSPPPDGRTSSPGAGPQPTPSQRLAELICMPDGTGVQWQTVRHWMLWLFAGFGWAGIIFAGALSTRSSPAECGFSFGEQAVICAMELPGTFLVQLVVDRPRGPAGMLGGRRGVQVLGFGAAGIATLLGALCAPQSAAALLCNMVARSLVAAANSAMSIAAPELYETTDRGLGSSLARLAYLLGSAPAAYWAYSSVSREVVAAGISVANLLAALLAATLPETTGVQLATLTAASPTGRPAA